MNILVISDSHGRRDLIDEIIRRQQKILPKGEVLTVLFLGDGLRDLYSSSEYKNVISYAVKGNCDFGAGPSPHGEFAPDFRIVELCGIKIFMTHGHIFDVKSYLYRAESEAIKQDADILLFGHTHSPCEYYVEGGTFEGQKKRLAVFNPGSLGKYKGTFGTITIKENEFILSHGEV